MEQMHVLSLGAGVQSSTMALMASRGLLEPMPEMAIFADTQREPLSVYAWLDWLDNNLKFPIVRVTKGDLGLEACRVRISEKSGHNYLRHNIPVYVKINDSKGMTNRACTIDFKIDPIYKELNKVRNDRDVIMWIGISLDEAHRMKPSRKVWAQNIWPLVDKRITRFDCVKWLHNNKYPEPPKSACVFCPYHNDAFWYKMKTEDKVSFDAAVQWEKEYQEAYSKIDRLDGVPFLHKSCIPLEDVYFNTDDENGQINMFGNECEGMCGI